MGVYGNDASPGSAVGVYGNSAEGIGDIGNSSAGIGVSGTSAGDGGAGVYASATGTDSVGVSGHGSTGIVGTGQTGVIGYGANVGAQGTDTGVGTNIAVSASLTNPANPSPALEAQTAGTGSAVDASIDNTSNASPALSATTNGTGPAVLASNTGGTALQVDGVASFSRSGIAKVAGKSTKSARTVKVTGVALTSSSLILATPQGTVSGVAVEGVTLDVSGSSFVVTLTKAIKVSLDIAWFVVG